MADRVGWMPVGTALIVVEVWLHKRRYICVLLLQPPPLQHTGSHRLGGIPQYIRRAETIHADLDKMSGPHSLAPTSAASARPVRHRHRYYLAFKHYFLHNKVQLPPQTPSQNPVSFPAARLPSPRMPSKFIKVRILTWNMHDSLPKGDVEELLGAVPPYDSHKQTPSGPSAFPQLSLEPILIIVKWGTGMSPVPRAAADKDKDKDDKEHKDYQDRHTHTPSQKRKDREKDEFTRNWKNHWLCHRTQVNPQVNGDPISKDITASPKRQSLHRRVTVKESTRDLYVHRDLRHLVQGTSKSAVTAGLIGGRVGNKGGVGISLKIDGSTFLFLNAHLAGMTYEITLDDSTLIDLIAHEGKVQHRLANLSKIKSEIAVDDFLPPGDPRATAEGSMRDWLICRQEYAQALAFDQLKQQMNGPAFSGFHEASIDFPPTFKYDVVGRSKTKRLRSKRTITDREGDSHEAEKENMDEKRIWQMETAKPVHFPRPLGRFTRGVLLQRPIPTRRLCGSRFLLPGRS
ncbi:hypothetical protein EDD15DRAFT_2200365 [Pisolithus albus]|nr:hypothetical protein EDD15DRAFT_2200365 [Pisolithus albus]